MTLTREQVTQWLDALTIFQSEVTKFAEDKIIQMTPFGPAVVKLQAGADQGVDLLTAMEAALRKQELLTKIAELTTEVDNLPKIPLP